MMEKKAIALLSGGLDSSLAVRMMLDQGVGILAVNFVSPFCNCTPHKAGCRHQARKIADEMGIPIRVIPKGMDYMKMVEDPPHGYGRGMNPCIDCRIYMLRKVKEEMGAAGASFIVTGEVLGQRPMSQHRQAMRLIEKESGLEGRILRPLCAHHFPPTLPEVERIVDREKLLSFSGRSRKPQMELAKKIGVKDYPCPAGGCLLTDKIIAARLKDLFLHLPEYGVADLHLLKVGRHFRWDSRFKVIVGRNQEENEKILLLALPGSTLFRPVEFRGPTVLACGKVDPETETRIGEIIARYSQDQKETFTIQKQVMASGVPSVFSVTKRFPQERLAAFRVGD